MLLVLKGKLPRTPGLVLDAPPIHLSARQAWDPWEEVLKSAPEPPRRCRSISEPDSNALNGVGQRT